MKYPNEFQMYFKDPATRACFISEIQSLKPGECPNCGSVGYLYIFVATGGPFRDPSEGKVNHWTKEGWYIGKTYQGLCPVCKNLEYHEGDGTDPRVEKAEHILASRWDLKKD